MSTSKFLILGVMTLVSTLLIPPRLLASTDYEEVSYDQLLDRISKKRTTINNNNSDTTFDDIKLHAGLGLLTSAANIRTSGSHVKFQNGFDLSLGIDLFDPNWTSEFAVRNFGTSENGSESRSLREFALKTFYRRGVNQDIAWKIGGGFASRTLRVDDSVKNIHIRETTPALIGFGGVETFLNRKLSLGFELGVRSALSSSAADQGSVDGAIRLDTHF